MRPQIAEGQLPRALPDAQPRHRQRARPRRRCAHRQRGPGRGRFTSEGMPPPQKKNDRTHCNCGVAPSSDDPRHRKRLMASNAGAASSGHERRPTLSASKSAPLRALRGRGAYLHMALRATIIEVCRPVGVGLGALVEVSLLCGQGLSPCEWVGRKARRRAAHADIARVCLNLRPHLRHRSPTSRRISRSDQLVPQTDTSRIEQGPCATKTDHPPAATVPKHEAGDA